MRISLLLPALSAGVLLAGCTGSTDPRTATVFDNIRNIQSGEYDRQIAANEAQAAALVRANQQTAATNASLERQRSANVRTISSLNSEIASVRAQAASVRRSLQADPAGNASELAQLASLERQLNAVQSDAASGTPPAVVRSELSRIRSSIRALSS